MEPVKYQRQLLRRYGITVVADGYIGFTAAFPNGKAQCAAIGTELDGVVQQIVDNLCDIILIGHGVHRMLRKIHIHIQMLVIDLLFKGNEHLTGAFFQIKVDLLFLWNTLLFL